MLVYQKGPLVATEILVYTICSSSTFNTIKLYNRNGTQYSLNKQEIVWSSLSPYLNETSMHASYT